MPCEGEQFRVSKDRRGDKTFSCDNQSADGGQVFGSCPAFILMRPAQRDGTGLKW